jgi:hypothetical protein
VSNSIALTTNKSFREYGLPYRITSLLQVSLGWECPVDVLMFLRNERPLLITQQQMSDAVMVQMLRQSDFGPRRAAAVVEVLIRYNVI